MSCRELGVECLTKQGTARSETGFDAGLGHRSSHVACRMSHLALPLSTVFLFVHFFLPIFLRVTVWITIVDEVNQHRDI